MAKAVMVAAVMWVPRWCGLVFLDASYRAAQMRGMQGRGRVFFFVNKKEAKKTLLVWVCARENARAPD
jgi:hypothetical protein